MLSPQIAKGTEDMDMTEFFRFARDFGIMPALFHPTELKVRGNNPFAFVFAFHSRLEQEDRSMACRAVERH